MKADLQSLYQRTVLEHCRSPRNFRAIERADRMAEGFNPLCGDKVTVYLREASCPASGSSSSGSKEFVPAPGENSGENESGPSVAAGKDRPLFLWKATPPALIAEVSFEAVGCAICVASASMMTEFLGGETAPEGRRRAEQVLAAFAPGAENGLSGLGNIVALGSVRAYPSRVRCVTLPWRTFAAALDGERSTVSTE